jgi:uncharacterized protein (DUF362 family)
MAKPSLLPAAGVPNGQWARPAPAGRVAVGSCFNYGPEVIDTLATMFDQLGGLTRLVQGKTVAVKLNLTAVGTYRLGYLPVEMTHWVHPRLIGAVVHLLGKAGARRIRLLESAMATAEPLPEFMLHAGWEPRDFQNAAPQVEFENTNYLGSGKEYSRLWVPGGGLMFKGYDLNHSYEDCDVFVSLAKLKEHLTTGITLSTKNCFGITPCTIYGDGAPEDEPGLKPQGGRNRIHTGKRLPPKSAPPVVDRDAYASKDAGYRVPRVVADLVAARPVHLAIIDGIHTMAGGEGPWAPAGRHVHPGLLVAGTNCVSTDAVGMALMGFDPMADRGTPPFETSDNMLRLAQQLGVGSRNLKQIEALGTPIAKVRFNFRRPDRGQNLLRAPGPLPCSLPDCGAWQVDVSKGFIPHDGGRYELHL